jgi:sulfur-oxidizing protein SoxX
LLLPLLLPLNLPTTLPLLALLTLATPPAWAAAPGDAARGRALLLQRQESGCILCHALPGLPTGGALGPPLDGLAQRYDSDSLRLRIADARRFNPQTVMPPYFSTEGLYNVARSRAGKTVLSEQALADIVAYLLATPSPADGSR